MGVSRLVADRDFSSMTVINDLIHLGDIPIEQINRDTLHLELSPAIHPLTPLAHWGNQICTMVVVQFRGEAIESKEIRRVL